MQRLCSSGSEHANYRNPQYMICTTATDRKREKFEMEREKEWSVCCCVEWIWKMNGKMDIVVAFVDELCLASIVLPLHVLRNCKQVARCIAASFALTVTPSRNTPDTGFDQGTEYDREGPSCWHACACIIIGHVRSKCITLRVLFHRSISQLHSQASHWERERASHMASIS